MALALSGGSSSNAGAGGRACIAWKGVAAQRAAARRRRLLRSTRLREIFRQALMADWIVPVTTLGAAGITGLVAYAGSRTPIRFAEATSAEEHWRERRTTYRLLVDQLVRFEEAMERPNAASAFDATAWFKSYSHLANGVRLFAPVAVRDAADQYELERRALFEQALAADAHELRDAYTQHIQAMRARQSELIREMRNDLAPDVTHGSFRRSRRQTSAAPDLTSQEQELQGRDA